MDKNPTNDSGVNVEREPLTGDPPPAADAPTPPAVPNGNGNGKKAAAVRYDAETRRDIRRLGVYQAALSIVLLVLTLVLWPRTDHLPRPSAAEDGAALVADTLRDVVEQVADLAGTPKAPAEGAAASPPPPAPPAGAGAEASPPPPPQPTPAGGAAVSPPATFQPPPSATDEPETPSEESTEAESEATATPAAGRILLLVIVVGMLGSVIGAISSFVSYVGNGTFKGSWLWWYLLRPLMGSMLALLLYFVAQAGFLDSPSVALGKGTFEELLYQAVAIAGLAGMFSKVTADKLEQIFATILQSGTDDQRKDKLDHGKDKHSNEDESESSRA